MSQVELEAIGETPPEPDRLELVATVVFGAVLVVLGAVLLVDAAGLPAGDEAVGPAVVPRVLGVLLAAVGAALALTARRDLARRGGTVQVGRDRWIRLAAMTGLLLAFAVLLPVLGYVVCAAGLFTGAALLLGCPGVARTIAYGWTLAVLVFLVFDRLIGLTLPRGPWGF